MPRGVSFTGEYLTRYLAGQKRWNEARDWRAKEAAAGRPSTYRDYCHAHGLCPACAATGISLNGNLLQYEECEACGGTGKIITPS
jgi:hypothetical protein